MTTDAGGNIYALTLDLDYRVYKISPAGAVEYVGGVGSLPEPDPFAPPLGDSSSDIAVDSVTGTVYFTAFLAQHFESPGAGFYKIVPGAGLSIVGNVSAPTFPLATDAEGNLYYQNNKRTAAGTVTSRTVCSGTELIAIDNRGAMYCSSGFAIYHVEPNSTATVLLAGDEYEAGTNDGTGSAARFGYNIRDIITDAQNNVYIHHSGGSLRKID